MNKSFDLYEIVTDRIITYMEQGNIPWKQNWTADLPHNFATGYTYNGINLFSLYLAGLLKNYKTSAWLTWNQIQGLKGSVKKGEKSEMVIFWTILERTSKTLDKNGKPKIDKIPFLKYTNVWNLDQITGIEEKDKREAQAIPSCEELITLYKDRPEIFHGGSHAFYSPSKDELHMPVKESFKTDTDYYATLFHELTHSTGHEKRLNREKDLKNGSFGSQDYSREELVAELGSAFMCAKAHISNQSIDKNHAAYLQNWLKVLKNDKKLIVEAAGKAQKAVNYMTQAQA